MNASLAQSMRQGWSRFSRQPFVRLVRHCVDRVFYGGDGLDGDELDFGIGAILGLLAMPGAFISILLSDKYSSLLRFLRHETHFDVYAASLPDEYFFIVLSMVVAGAVAIWKWDKLLPDRRDYANLAPLPIPSRKYLSWRISPMPCALSSPGSWRLISMPHLRCYFL